MDNHLMQHAAEQHMGQGWPLVLHKNKRPLFRNWEQGMERRRILYELGRSAYGIGLLLGPVEVVVIDDDSSGGDTATNDWLCRHRVFHKSPMETITAKGVHSYFRLPDTVKEVRSRIGFFGKLDILMGARFTVAAPTFITDPVEWRYQLRGKIVPPSELPMLPDSVVEELNAEPEQKSISLPYVPFPRTRDIRFPELWAMKVESVMGANGSGALVRVVTAWRDCGRSAEETLTFLREMWNPVMAKPPWSDGELVYCVRRHFNL